MTKQNNKIVELAFNLSSSVTLGSPFFASLLNWQSNVSRKCAKLLILALLIVDSSPVWEEMDADRGIKKGDLLFAHYA